MANFDKYSATYEDKKIPELPTLTMEEIRNTLSQKVTSDFHGGIFSTIAIFLMTASSFALFLFCVFKFTSSPPGLVVLGLLFGLFLIFALFVVLLVDCIMHLVKAKKKYDLFRTGEFSVVSASFTHEEIKYRSKRPSEYYYHFYGYGRHKLGFLDNYKRASVGDMFYIVVFDKDKSREPALIYRADNYKSFERQDRSE